MGEQAVFRIFIEAPVERVWREVVRRDEPNAIFFGNCMRIPGPGGDNGALEQGCRIRMRTKNGKHTIVVGEVTEFDPPRRFAHTFRFTTLDDPACTVVYDLKPVEGGTEFTLTILDIPVGTKTEKYMRQGGDFITATLKGLAEKGKPPLSKRLMLAMMSAFAFTTPKRCLSEHWA